MSVVTEEGMMTVRNEACDQLLAQRVEIKRKRKKTSDVMNRLHVAMPTERSERETTLHSSDNAALSQT